MRFCLLALKMEVILKVDIDRLGKSGQTVKVKDGFARNYLLPKGFALEATEDNLKVIQQENKARLERVEKERSQAEELKERISFISCTIPMPAGPDDKLFGAVTSQDIQEALQKEGIAIDKKKIQLDEPINKIGIYSVGVKLHPEITAYLKVWVIKE